MLILLMNETVRRWFNVCIDITSVSFFVFIIAIVANSTFRNRLKTRRRFRNRFMAVSKPFRDRFENVW